MAYWRSALAALAAQSLQGRVVVVMRVNAPNLEQGLSLVVSVRELYLLWPALVEAQANLALARGIKL